MALDRRNWIESVRGAAEGIVDRLAASRPASAIAILIVAVCCFLPGLNTIPAVDREETSFAEAAKRMVASGDYGDIEPLPGVHEVAPIGMYWLEAASFALLSGDAHPPIWVFRLPALLGAIATALLTWWMALAFGRPRAALIAGALIAANIVLAGEARVARADAVLLATIVLAEGALARLWLRTDDKQDLLHALLFWAALGAGILLKGPIAPLVLVLTVAVLSFREPGTDLLRRLRPAWGAMLALILVLPWILLMEPDISGGTGAELVKRLAGELDPRGPPGSYALAFLAIFFPGAPFFLIAIPWMVREIRQPAVLFGVAWAVPVWLVTELFPVKLPHLMLPAFPAIALLAAVAIDAGGVRIKGWPTRFLALGPLLWPLIVAIGVPVFLWAIRNPVPYAALGPLIAGVAIGVPASYWLRRGAPVAAAAASVVSAIVIYLGLFAFVLPEFDRIHLSERLVTLSRKALSCANPQYASAGYVEPGLLFLNGDDIRFTDGAAAADFLNGGGCRLAFVETRQLSSFRQRAEDLGVDLVDGGGAFGFNLGNGLWVRTRVFTAQGSAP